MAEDFHITGVDPGTGLVIQFTLTAATEMDARRQAEETGLRHVLVQARPSPDTEYPN